MEHDKLTRTRVTGTWVECLSYQKPTVHWLLYPRTVLVTWFLTKHWLEWNLKNTSLSWANLETLKRFLEVDGMWRSYFRTRSLDENWEGKVDWPMCWIARPVPSPIWIWSFHVYVSRIMRLLGFGVQWLVALESGYQLLSVTTLRVATIAAIWADICEVALCWNWIGMKVGSNLW